MQASSAKLGNSEEFHQFGSQCRRAYPLSSSITWSLPYWDLYWGPQNYFQEESMCGLIDSFHMQHCQCQARSSLSDIIQSLGQTIQILVIMDKQFACHRFPATKASTASPKRCCVPLVQPPATGITIFHSASGGNGSVSAAVASFSLNKRLSNRPSLPPSPSHQLTVRWQHHTFSLTPPQPLTALLHCWITHQMFNRSVSNETFWASWR